MADEFLAHVLEVIATAGADRVKERRRRPRFGLRGKAMMSTISPKKSLYANTVRVRDVSAEGICVLAPQALPKNSIFELHLTAAPASGFGELYVRCEVQHCSRLSDGTHRIGARINHHASSGVNVGAATCTGGRTSDYVLPLAA